MKGKIIGFLVIPFVAFFTLGLVDSYQTSRAADTNGEVKIEFKNDKNVKQELIIDCTNRHRKLSKHFKQRVHIKSKSYHQIKLPRKFNHCRVIRK